MTLPGLRLASLGVLAVLIPVSPVRAAEAGAAARPSPTVANLAYGPHERQVLDLWRAVSDRPTPLAVFIHGGGFSGGDKAKVSDRDLVALLEAGISVAAVNYRFIQRARLPAAHRDVSRAVQFLRQRAAEWRLDTSRFGGFGGSAGAQLVMYLAFHDDLADPRSADPVARESSRLACVAPQGGQASMGLEWWDAHIPHNTTRASRLPSLAAWNEKWFGTSDPVAAAAIVAETSALALLTRDDPPVFLTYGMPPDSPHPADPQAAENWISHHVAHGIALKKRCDELGVEAHLKYPGARPRYASGIEFLKARLLAP